MIRVEKTHLPVAALTHPGMKGKNNEDRFGVSAFRMKTRPATPVLLAVLSDGIGGNRAGEVASELAVNLISQAVAVSDGKNPLQILQNAFREASERIYQQAQANPEQQGMGATCACVWVAGDRIFTATVGDSRVYLIRNETIRQLSIDHTWIQEALDRGLIEPDQVAGHPNAHVIRRYLGSAVPPEVDFRINLNGGSDEDMKSLQGMKLLSGDSLLLCSDGLTDLVTSKEIETAFYGKTLEEAGNLLIDLANQRGGHDNITLIAIQSPEGPTMAVPVSARARSLLARPRSLIIGCLGIILLAAVIGGLAGGWILNAGSQPTATPSLMAGQSLATPTSPTRMPIRTRTPTMTYTPLGPGLIATPTLPPGFFPTVTPWPTNTPRLPVVTVSR